MSVPDYQPLVPRLEELRLELLEDVRRRTTTGREPEAPSRAVWPTPARRRARRGERDGVRILRRVAVLAALIALIGGVAVAARIGLSGGGKADTTPVRLAEGRGWALGAYRHGGHLCAQLVLGPEISVECDPSSAHLRVTSALAPGRRLVVGIAGPRVRSVRIALAGRTHLLATRRAPDAGAAEAAGLPTGTRWFALEVQATGDRADHAPALVAPLAADGRALAAPAIDCSLGATSRLCLRGAGGQIEAELR